MRIRRTSWSMWRLKRGGCGRLGFKMLTATGNGWSWRYVAAGSQYDFPVAPVMRLQRLQKQTHWRPVFRLMNTDRTYSIRRVCSAAAREADALNPLRDGEDVQLPACLEAVLPGLVS